MLFALLVKKDLAKKEDVIKALKISLAQKNKKPAAVQAIVCSTSSDKEASFSLFTFYFLPNNITANILDLSKHLLALYDGLVATKLATSDSHDQPVALINNVVIPAMSEAIVPVKLTGECRYNDVLIEPRTKPCKTPLWVAR